MHFCGSKLASISVNHEAKSCCNMKGGCCHNENIKFEVEDDFLSSVYIENYHVVLPGILSPILFTINFEFLSSGEKAFARYTDSSPPLKQRARLSLIQSYLC